MRALRSADQMGLFHPRSPTQQWADLPAEARQQTLSLLARPLRLCRGDLLVEPQERALRDE